MQIQGVKAIIIGGASGFARATAQRIADGGGSVAILDREESAGAEVAADARGNVASDERARLRRDRRRDRRGRRRPRWTARRRQHRRWRQGGAHAGAWWTVRSRRLPRRDRSQPDRHVQHQPSVRSAHGRGRTERRRRARCADQHLVDRGVRGADRSGRVHRREGGHRRDDVDDGADLGSLGIRVNTIAPSLFATGLTAGVTEERAANLTKDAAFPKRLGRPDEYARLAIAIIENPMLNGDTIRLDAGTRFAPK